MTRTKDPVWDVYVSHSPLNIDVAQDVAEAFRKAGLDPFERSSDDAAGAEAEKRAWSALGECRALVLVVTRGRAPSALQMVEFGAARAWTKSVFVVTVGSSPEPLPPTLAKQPTFPIGRLDEVIQAVRASTWPLSDDEREALRDLYQDFGTPVDQFFQSPSSAEEFTFEFERRANRKVAEERLMTELLRMRKSGRLPRLRAKPA